MALDAKTTHVHPIQVNLTAGSDSGVALLIGSGSPTGNTDPWNSAGKGSLHLRIDQTDDISPLYAKVDADGSSDDWVPVMVNLDEGDRTLGADLTFSTDKRTYYRDTNLSIYSPSACKLSVLAPSGINFDKMSIGSGTCVVSMLAGSGAIAWGALAASAASTACYAITGVTQNHYVHLSPSGMAGCLVLTSVAASPGGGLIKVDVINMAVETTAACDMTFSYLAVGACGP